MSNNSLKNGGGVSNQHTLALNKIIRLVKGDQIKITADSSVATTRDVSIYAAYLNIASVD